MADRNVQEQLQKRYPIHTDKQHQAIYEMLPYYESAVILGDSVAESILDFRLLRKNNVVAKRGRCVDDIQGDILVAVSLQPTLIFMEYGKNDIRHFAGNVNNFIRHYEQQIHMLKRLLPEAEIYVNSIIPMREDIMERYGGQDMYDSFNTELQAMCVRLHIGFIDNFHLIDWKDTQFEYDGVHPKYPYYPKWLRHMAICAGRLTQEAYT